MRGTGERRVGRGLEEHVAAGRAGHAVGAEAVERAVRIGGRHRLIGAENGDLEIDEPRRVGPREDHVHGVRAVGIDARDRLDDAQVASEATSGDWKAAMVAATSART